MDWLPWLLFESLPVLAALLFTANFVLLVYWRRSGRARPLVVGLAAAVVLLAVQTLVVTRREHALRLMAGVEKDVVAARTDALAAALAPDFEAGDMGPRRFVEFVERQYEKVRVRAVSWSTFRVTDSRADRFVVAVAYQAEVTVRDYAGRVRTRWEITFVRTDVGWRIGGIQPTYIDGLPSPDWLAIDRH